MTFSPLNEALVSPESLLTGYHVEERVAINRLSRHDYAIYVDDYASPQLAIDAAIAAGGGDVGFGRGTYTLTAPLRIAYGGEAPVTLRGQGIGHETANTILQVPDGGTGIEIVNTAPSKCMTVHLQDFEVRGGAYGIHLLPAPSAWPLKNCRWQRLNCRLQTEIGIFLESPQFHNYYADILVFGSEPLLNTVGVKTFDVQNRNTYDRLEIRHCGTGFMVDAGPSERTQGAVGNIVFRDCLIEANLGPGMRFVNSGPERGQFVHVFLEADYFEHNGGVTGEADIVVEGDTARWQGIGLMPSSPSPAQIAAPGGPLLLDIQNNGTFRTSSFWGLGAGNRGIRQNGDLLLKPGFSPAAKSFSTYWDVWGMGNSGPVLKDEPTGKLWRLFVESGQVKLQDVTSSIV